MKYILCLVLITNTILVFGQNDEKRTFTDGLSISLELGVNTNWQSNEYTTLVFPNYSIGIIKMWQNEKRLNHGIAIQFNPIQFKLNDVPVSTTSTKDQSFYANLLYVGWRGALKVYQDKFNILLDAGTNYVFNEKYTSDINNKSSGWEIPLSTDIRLRPQISFGIGKEISLANLDLMVAPKYGAMFSMNGVAQSFGVELGLTF